MYTRSNFTKQLAPSINLVQEEYNKIEIRNIRFII